MSIHTLHFDFNHLENPHQHLMFLKIRGKKYQLNPHNDQTLGEAAEHNTVLKTLLKHKPSAITHHVQVPTEHFHDNSLTKIQVVGHADETDPNNYLPPLYHVSYMPHINDHKRYFKKLNSTCDTLKSRVLHGYDLADIDTDDPWQDLVDQYHLKGPLDVALYLAGMHPMTLSNKPNTHLAMQNEHIYPVHKTDPDSINQLNQIGYLRDSIKTQGQPGANAGFARVKTSVNPVTQKPTQFDFPIGPRSKGDAVLIYDLTDETAEKLAPVAARPVQTSRNDPQFQNQTWSVNQGQSNYDIANHKKPNTTPHATMAALDASPTLWQVSPNTSTHGMSVDQSSIKFDGTNFSVDVNNNFLRIVGAYIQFYSDTDMGKPIENPEGWVEKMSIPAFESTSKKFIDMVPNVNSVLGIPLPTDPTNLSFVWPTDAESAKLMFGGMGTYNYDKNIVWPGFIETGIFQFGIPLFFMVAGAAITDSSFYKEFIKDTVDIFGSEFVNQMVGNQAVGDYSGSDQLKEATNTFGLGIASVLVSKGLEKLAEEIMLEIAAAEVADEVPFIGWALRVLSMALDAAEMLVSLGEVLSSPAVIEVGIKRQMTFNFTLKPDQKHGEAGHPGTAIWPAVADHYRLMVNYQNGTGFEAKGKTPLTSDGGSSNAPIVNSFTVPWGGKMQVIAAIYSKTGWLCGKYASDWMDAVPDPATFAQGIKASDGSITELLVPLSQDTQYSFQQKIAYSPEKNHYWWGVAAGATVPTDTVSSLNPTGAGNNIASLTGITINESDFVIGYGWQGAGENIPLENGTDPNAGLMYVFQNLSVLSDPESRMKFPSFGFGTKPGLAYDVYGGNEKQEGLLNFVLDTRGDQPGYLRKITLMDGNPSFPELNSGQSYGTFSIGDVDAMAVHPSGYVIAANWKDHRLQILKLAEEAVPDADAPAAVIVSNKGIQEGLVLGPIALAISPDGKIMVLESISQRVQAFDIAGNPAPTFLGRQLFVLPNAGALVGELNNRIATAPLISSFVTNGASQLFYVEASLASDLDKGGYITQDILDALAANMLYPSYKSDAHGNILPDKDQTSAITVITPGSQWNIVDPGRNYTYILSLTDGLIAVSDQFNNTEVIVLIKDNSWQLKDLAGGRSYIMNLNGTDLEVSEYLSYFPINPQQEQLNYCDIAIESKGYLYVLAYKGDPAQGTIPNTAYVLDVYTPQGAHLFRTPDANIVGSDNMEYISAGKIALDIWRNLFALNYERLSGPGGRTEPSVSQWIPTPPLFDLSTDDVPTLDAADMSKIIPLFATHEITLSPSSTCEVLVKSAHWRIKDATNSKQYDIISIIGEIAVYSIAAT